MMFSELCALEIRKPFTVSSLFDENFYVNFKIMFSVESLIEEILVSGSSYSLCSLEDGEFVFEECGTKINEEVRKKLTEEGGDKSQMILVTAGYSEDNPICTSVMDDEKDRILMCAYIKTLFDIFFKKYGFKNIYSILHHQQINGEFIELPHVHCVLKSPQGNEGYELFTRDFSDNIFDE